ncbi:hypothetical protein T492DRAFT_878404 [Pavlovales sp. CCMP2436]|nr:hypothetical protein T492DRAFT_878404 [Pavlovales sp. CCMP2436]
MPFMTPLLFSQVIRAYAVYADEAVEAWRNGMLEEQGKARRREDCLLPSEVIEAVVSSLRSTAAGLEELERRPYDADAAFELAMRYYEGESGMHQDHREAARLFRLAANQGHASAQYMIGNAYYEGEGEVQNHREAARYFQLGADQGHALAQYLIAQCYNRGEGAARLFRLASNEGIAEAQFNYGKLYALGEGTPQNYEVAVRYFRLAADQGLAAAHRPAATPTATSTPYNLALCELNHFLNKAAGTPFDVPPVQLRAFLMEAPLRGTSVPRSRLDELCFAEGIKADRKLWLRYDWTTNCMHCDACIRFNTTHPPLNFITGCNNIRLDRDREHDHAGETNGHGDALFKLINSTKLGEDFSALLTKQISLESDQGSCPTGSCGTMGLA